MKPIPLTPSLLHTYQDTGQCMILIPADCQWRADIEPKEHSSHPGYWIPYCSDGRVANGEPGQADDDCGITAPWVAGQRVGIKCPLCDDDGYPPMHHGLELALESVGLAKCAWCTNGIADHATVQFIVLLRRDDRWMWVVGLEKN